MIYILGVYKILFFIPHIKNIQVKKYNIGYFSFSMKSHLKFFAKHSQMKKICLKKYHYILWKNNPTYEYMLHAQSTSIIINLHYEPNRTNYYHFVLFFTNSPHELYENPSTSQKWFKPIREPWVEARAWNDMTIKLLQVMTPT